VGRTSEGGVLTEWRLMRSSGCESFLTVYASPSFIPMLAKCSASAALCSAFSSSKLRTIIAVQLSINSARYSSVGSGLDSHNRLPLAPLRCQCRRLGTP